MCITLSPMQLMCKTFLEDLRKYEVGMYEFIKKSLQNCVWRNKQAIHIVVLLLCALLTVDSIIRLLNYNI